MKTSNDYEAQLQTMKERADAWRRDNPHKQAKIQFNFPPGVCVIAAISEAIKAHYVSKTGLELLKAMWPWNVKNEPTVLMCRAVLEYESPKG